MNKPARSIEWMTWGGLALVMVTLVSIAVLSKLVPRSPAAPVYGTVPEFSLTNQAGNSVSLSDLRGQVWVADIIFTRCPGPCAKMTRQMAQVQAALRPADPVRLVSLTADPEFDTPPVLKAYGERFGASPNHWQFLTGKKTDVYRLATKGLMLVLDETPPEKRESDADLFVHSTLFVVIDRLGRIRGSFEGSEPAALPRLLDTVRALIRERQP